MSRRMNASHSELTDWALAQISIGKEYTILDVGCCGGGRTVAKLAEIAALEKVFGVNYSRESVAYLDVQVMRNTTEAGFAGRVEKLRGRGIVIRSVERPTPQEQNCDGGGSGIEVRVPAKSCVSCTKVNSERLLQSLRWHWREIERY